MEPGTPIPFIVGCGRSGTTILRLMLNAHPDLAVPPESHFLRRVAEQPERTTPAGLLESALSSERFADWGIDPDEVRAQAVQHPPSSLAEATDLLFSSYAQAHGKARWGDKTPPYVMCMDGLAKILPDARFVHIIRDGRDVALSYSSVSFGPRDDPVAQAEFWSRRVEAGRRSGERLGSRRYLEVRYEHLVSDPETVLKQICRSIDLPFDASMLGYQTTVEEALPSSKKAFHTNADKPIARDLRDWRTAMSSEDRAAFDAVAGDLLRRLGYEVLGGPTPHGIARRIAVERFRHKIGTLRTRLGRS
jgi:hypothetical protein